MKLSLHAAGVALTSLWLSGIAPSAFAQSPQASEVLTALQAQKIDDAVQLSDSACDDGDMASCMLSGFIHATNQFGIEDTQFARMRFSTACDGGFMEACTPLAQMQYNGLGGPVDKPAAYATTQKACDAGNQEACSVSQQIQSEIAPARPDTPPTDWNQVASALNQMSEALKDQCGIEKEATVKAIQDRIKICTAYTSKFSKAAFDLSEAAPADETAVTNFMAAWALVTRNQMFLELHGTGRLKADPMKVQCRSYETAKFFMDRSAALKEGDLSLRYVTVDTQISTGQSICDKI